MALDPKTLDYKAAKAFLPAAPILMGRTSQRNFETEIIELLENGDFWQNARRYVGPLPSLGEGHLAAMELIKKSFAPILKLREVLRRHVRGVIGKEPQFEAFLDPSMASKNERRRRDDYANNRDELEMLADEVDDVQADLWDEEGEHKIAQAMVKRLCSTGVASLRFGIPPAVIVPGVDRETGEEVAGVDVGTWQDAYRMTYMELIPFGAASVFIDPFSRKKTAFYSYNEPVDEAGKKTRQAIQISWVDDGGLTQVRVVRDKVGDVDEWAVDTGGILLVVDSETDPLLKPDLLQLQDIICSIGTNIKINSDVAGHPQMTTIDIAPPKVLVPAPTEGHPDATKAVPTALKTGARTVQMLHSEYVKDGQGNPMKDQSGKPIIRSGTLEYREPVSSEPLRSDIEFFAQEIYSAVNQRHVPARVSANASAEMLAEMRADFADSLMETKPDVEKALRNVLKARLCMAAYLAGDTANLEKFKAGRIRVDLQLNAGPLSVEERDEILHRRDAGLLSDETAMVLLGDGLDVESELKKISEQKAELNGNSVVPVPGSKAPAKKEKAVDAA